MIVVDASVVLELLLGLPLGTAAQEQLFGADGGAHAPDHLNAEVLHVLRRYERRGIITAERSHEGLADLLDLPIARYPSLALIERAWALRRDLTAYDALYVALAEALDASLVTADGRLSTAAAAHTGITVTRLSS